MISHLVTHNWHKGWPLDLLGIQQDRAWGSRAWMSLGSCFRRSLCNRHITEILHTPLDLFRGYRAIQGNANSNRKTTNGQIHCWKRFKMLPRIGLIVVSLKGHNFWSRTSCEVYNSDLESPRHALKHTRNSDENSNSNSDTQTRIQTQFDR